MKQKKSVSELKSHIGYHLRVVSNAVSSSFAKRLADSGVTVAEWVILREMYSNNGSTSPSDVAELTGLTRGAVSKLIERLLNKGFVSRAEATDDRRYQEIELTTSAIRLVPHLAALADENDEDFFSSLTASERKTLMTLLEKLTEANKIKNTPIT